MMQKHRAARAYTVIYQTISWYNRQMAMSIKNLQVERLAREIAGKTGESLTGAIQKALEERLDRLKTERAKPGMVTQLEDILRRVDQMPVVDPRPADEILGYDDRGLPR